MFILGSGPASQIATTSRVDPVLPDDEQRFSQLMTASPVAIAISALERACFVEVNPAYTQLFGYRRDDLIGRSSVEMDLWADDTQRDDFMLRIDTGQAVDRQRIDIRCKGGNVRSVIVSAEIMTFDGELCVLSQLVDITEQQEQAARLEQSENRLRALFESAAEGIVVHERDGSISMVNASAERILGMTSEQMIGMHHGREILLATRPDGSNFPVEERPAMRALLTGVPQVDEEMRVVRSDGSVVWISINARPIFAKGEREPISVLASFIDVTERRVAERALRTSEERFRTLAANAPICIFQSDALGSCLFLNEAWERITGRTPDSGLGTGWLDAVHPEDRVAVERKWTATVFAQLNSEIEYRILRDSGEIRQVISRSNPIRNATDQIVGYVGTLEDVTDQRIASEALRQSEESLRRSHEHAVTGLAINDLEGKFIDVNPALCAMTGYSEAELLERSFVDLTHPDDRPYDAVLINELLTGRRRSYRREKRYITRNGREIWVEVSVSLVRTSDGLPYQIVAQIQDINQRKAAERTLRDSESRFRALLANGADIVLLLDRDGIVRWASPSVQRTLGVEPGAMIGRSNSELVHPEDARALRQEFVATIRSSAEPHVSTLRFRHRDGTYRWLEAVGSNHLTNPAIRGIVYNARDVSDRIELEARLRQEALHDHLTGLPNRSLLESHLESALAAARRYDELAGLLFVDLDRFKEINDQLGHAAGDQLLIQVGQRLIANVRPVDTVARLGGDEFCVVLTRVKTPEEVEGVIDRLRSAFTLPVPIAGSAVSIGASIGMAISSGFDSSEDLLARADSTMYQQKYARRDHNTSQVRAMTDVHEFDSLNR